MFALNLKWEREDQRNFATYSDFSVDIKDEIYASKVLRDNWTLIGNKINSFKNTAPYFYQNVVRRSRRDKALSSSLVPSTRELICQFCLFRFSILQPNVYKIYKKNNAWMNNTMCSKKVPCKKFRDPKMADISQQHVKTASKVSYLTWQT